MIQKKSEITFGEWLRKRRRELDLTQQELADQTGCARITVRKLESDLLKPSKELAELLLKKLGVPNSELSKWVLYARGLAGYPTHNQVSVRTNLPAQLTSFIGREREMDEVKDALSKHRLVTLTGSGGAGKTRLSLQVAAGLPNAFPDGVWFIELAPLSDPALIPQTVQNTLGLLENKNVGVLESLQEYLKSRKTLLVLDNCEHLIQDCANLANNLLSRSTDLKILVSSREALDVMGEFAWRVPSLAFPDVNHIPDVERLSQYEAIKLFVERAELVDPKFKLNENNAPSIAQICIRLDGIPLAIELAAARLKTLSVEQIHARLDDRFNLLTNGGRVALPRHQTLRATIDWSYNLLSEDEKTLFRRLAVFTGGFGLEGAESVCMGDGIRKEDVLDLLTGLVHKSLINAEESSEEVRYRRLETIRQYGKEKFIVTDEAEKIRERHLHFYVELAERAEPELRGPNQAVWFKRLEVEMDNLRSAMGWARERDGKSFLRLASSLWPFFRSLEYRNEGIEWLIKAVEENGDMQTKLLSTAQARLSNLCSYFSVDQDSTEKYANAAIELGGSVNDKFAVALALISLSELALERRDGVAGTRHIEQALEIARMLEDHWLISTALYEKGKFSQIQNPMIGRTVIEEGLAEARLSGDKRLVCIGLFWMIPNLIITGDFTLAKACAQERLPIATEIADKDGIIFSQIALGNIGLYEEDYLLSEEYAENAINLGKSFNHNSGLLHSLGIAGLANLASRNFPRVLELAQEMEIVLMRGGHFKTDVGYHLFLRAWVAILKGDVEGVSAGAKEIINTYRNEKNILIYIESLRILASWKFIVGSHDQCVILSGVAEGLRQKVILSYFDYPFMTKYRAGQVARCREVLGEEVFNKAMEKGSALTVEEVMGYAHDLVNE